MQLISIDLVRRLVSQMDSGVNINPDPFLTLMPIGWYRVEFETLTEGDENTEIVQRLVIVFENEKASYEQFIKFLETLKESELKAFIEPNVSFDNQHQQLIENFQNRFFSNIKEQISGDLLAKLFHITRHMAQNYKAPPDWFDFEQRQEHDLDAVAQTFIDNSIGPNELVQSLQKEYNRIDRYWKIIYYSFNFFKSHCDGCVNRILLEPKSPDSGSGEGNLPFKSKKRPPYEPSDEIKKQIKKRDGFCCLCCGEDNKDLLEIDHINSKYHGGEHSLDNLQTLCKTCNGFKGTREIDFRKHQTSLKESPSSFPDLELPKPAQAGDPKQWEQFIHRSANFFYQCAAVKSVEVKNRGTHIYPWEICIHADNHPRWLKPHLEDLTKKIRNRKKDGGFDTPYKIIMTGFDFEEIT